MTTEDLTKLRYDTLIARLSQPDSLPTMVDLLAACHTALTKAQRKPVFISKRTIQDDLKKLREGVLGQVYVIEVVQKKYYRLVESVAHEQRKSEPAVSKPAPPHFPESTSFPFCFPGMSPELDKAFFPIKTVALGRQNWVLLLCPEDASCGAIPANVMAQAQRLPDFPGWTKQSHSTVHVQEMTEPWFISPENVPFWAMYGSEDLALEAGMDNRLEMKSPAPWWVKYTIQPKVQPNEPDTKWEKKLEERLDKKGYAPAYQALSPLTNVLIDLAGPADIPQQNEILLTSEELFWVKKWTGLAQWLKTLEKAWQLTFSVEGYWQATQNGMLPATEKGQNKGNKHQVSIYLNPSTDSDLHFSIWPGSHKQKEPDLFKPSKNLMLAPGQIWVCKTKLYRQVAWNPTSALIRLDLIPSAEKNDD